MAEDKEEWFPTNYSPKISVGQWVELLCEKEVFQKSSLVIMRRLLDCGGRASYRELAEKYGNTISFYQKGSLVLAKRIQEKTNCPIYYTESGQKKWWPILYLGVGDEKNEPSNFIWKLRTELKEALVKINLSEVPLFEKNKIVSEKEERLKKLTEKYTRKEFLEEVYLSEEKLDTLQSLLKRKKNLILRGAPGVGKTFTAKRLAYVMMGETDDSRVEWVQFHQSYSYEDFILGYKPVKKGFELMSGIFYNFCKKASNDLDRPYFFIIDEINRGNLSRIFGELLVLIEKDYRGTEATLAYGGESFSVPENLFLIGMMNMADRSLATIDYALRRRFSFFELEPSFDSEGFRSYQSALADKTFDALIKKIKELNFEIQSDNVLGKGFLIGHSYFCGQKQCTREWLKEIVEYEILPLLEEYWFDEPEKLENWQKSLRGVFYDKG